MALETVLAMDRSAITFGPGAIREIGDDVMVRGCCRVMLRTVPRLVDWPIAETATSALDAEGVACAVFDRVCVGPTDASIREAIDFAMAGGYDGFVAVGGGLEMVTAKAAIHYSSYPAGFWCT